MSEKNNAEVFAEIEEETKNFLSGEKLKNALDLLSYLKESGRTWVFPTDGHPEFYYMNELTCLLAYSNYGEEDLSAIRRSIEEAGNRFEDVASPCWTICCWQHGDDIYELESFPVDEGVKEFAQLNVWKCIYCGGCDAPGGRHRAVFGKEYENACCNVFQFGNPDSEDLKNIKKLMELQKHIIANSKNKSKKFI
jgi:hypothetical protein